MTSLGRRGQTLDTVFNGVITHIEHPAKPYYSLKENAAGITGADTGKSSRHATDRELVDR